ncbi:MAG: hypothetical protein CM15mP40_14120 [Alphaproteobacteria bacterium]|nr:MAG: hypothetical protein CM15mP40_14120 [Alphaproteobacteria bacterium]
MDQEISASGSGELDNGFVVTLSHGMSGEETAKSDTSSLTIDMGDMGTLSYNDADGHPGLAGLEDFMPMAYEQANDGIATHNMAKMASGQGFGYSTSVGGASISIGYSDGMQLQQIELMERQTLQLKVLPHHLLLEYHTK